MGELHEILLCSNDHQRRDRWERELDNWGRICTDWEAAGSTAAPELIITDQLPLPQPLGRLATLVASGEIPIVGVGTQGPADAVLPADHTGRELRLACQLLSEVAQLRRTLAQEYRTQQALRKMVYRDPLTGLANRRKWDLELVSRMDHLRGAGGKAVLGVVLLDLDLFKQLNDRLGHVAGDTALQRVAQKLAANVAQQHLAARLGGDEFGLLLSGVLATDVPRVADLLRQSIEHELEESRDDVSPADDVSPVTASAGVVVVTPGDRVRPLEALKAADQALRAAKAQGRDQTVLGQL